MSMNAFGKKVVNGVEFSVEVSGNNVKISTNKKVSLEDIFSVSEEMLKSNEFKNLPRVTAYFDDTGDLVIKEKVHGHSSKVMKRYNLDRLTYTAIIPLTHILAYGSVSDMSAMLANYR